MARNVGREHQPAPLARQPARDKPSLAGGREAQPEPSSSPVGNQALQGELRSLQHLTAAVGLAAKEIGRAHV